MTADLRARSPLDGWTAAFEGVRLAELPCTAQVNLRVDAADAASVEGALGVALPVEPCTSSGAGDITVLWLGPDEWLVLGPAHAGAELTGRLRAALTAAGGRGAVTDVSAQRTVLRVAGAGAAGLLAKGCSIDLRPRVSPPGTCVQTLLAQAGIILLVESGTSFLLVVRASFAEYVAAWLTDAAPDPG